MELIAQVATKEDVTTILDIANSNLLALNPNDIPMGEIEGHEFVRGFFDPAITRLTKLHSEDDWESFITLNPDSSRKRFYLDIYTKPGAQTLAASLDLALGNETAESVDEADRFSKNSERMYKLYGEIPVTRLNARPSLPLSDCCIFWFSSIAICSYF